MSLRPVDLNLNQTVDIHLVDGACISGVIAQMSSDRIGVLTVDRNIIELNRDTIDYITGPEPIFDSQGILVPEKDIESVQNSLNLTTHAVFGGLISLGVGLFSGALLSDQVYKPDNVEFIASVSALSTACGGYFFARSGAIKDREVAIEKIIKQRNDLSSDIRLAEEADEKLIRERIETLIREQNEKNLEIDSLRREIRALDMESENSQ
ncbi:MAG: hypothetical protein EHM72_02095 [Calditrichaeota bacterium]|nr:MAG: hypothetical protein EHM72_02095 [Calditrichota bacterium]